MVANDINRNLTPVELAELFHNKYMEATKETGWEVQKKTTTDFDSLPRKNRENMIKTCEQILKECNVIPIID